MTRCGKAASPSEQRWKRDSRKRFVRVFRRQPRTSSDADWRSLARPPASLRSKSLLSDPERGAAARQALEQIPVPEAGQALLASLANADLPTYIALVHSLGARREIGRRGTAAGDAPQ